MRSYLATFCTIALILSLGASCTNRGRSQNSSPEGFLKLFSSRPAVLTKDDALLVDQTRLSITGLLELKKSFVGVPREQLLWAVTGVVAVQNHGRALNKEISPEVSIRIINFALSKSDLNSARAALVELNFGSEKIDALSSAQAKAWVDDLMSRSVIQKNVQVLAEVL